MFVLSKKGSRDLHAVAVWLTFQMGEFRIECGATFSRLTRRDFELFVVRSQESAHLRAKRLREIPALSRLCRAALNVTKRAGTRDL